MLNVLDLFAGIGGFSLGLERTGGFRTVAFCEIDKKAQRVLNKHWPDTPIFDDVSALTKDLIDETVGVPVHVITGGFPCQDISLAGKGAGLEGERSGLWFQFHRLIKEIQPRYAIIENVSALRSRGLEVVLGGLAEIGYDAEWHCIPAAAIGAPHRRDRVWIVAYPRISDRVDAQADAQRPDANGIGSHRAPVNIEGSSEPRDEQVGVAGSLGKVLAFPQGSDVGDAECFGRGPQRLGHSEDDRDKSGAASEHASPLADALRARLQGHTWDGAEFRLPQQDGPVASQGVCRGGHPGWWWAAEPDVGRVAHGVPNRVDRLKQLGNAVVPQIPQLLGEAILDWENARVAA